MVASSNKNPETGEKTEKVKITIEETVPKIRVVFMGTPLFAATILQSMVERGYNIVGVVTKPDKPVGRKQESVMSKVKEVALTNGLPILQPEKLDDTAIESISALKPDLIVVAAYGKILPKKALKIPGLGCINVHASLLPRWRGASPIQNALLAGDTETGITIMLMDEGMDTGDILAQRNIPIDQDVLKSDLETLLAEEGSALLLHTIPAWVDRTIEPITQDDTNATLCQLIDREDGRIFWNNSAEEIYNRYRALSPWPGIFTFWKRGEDLVRMKLHTIKPLRQSPQIPRSLGEVFEIGDAIGVQTGSGVILLEEIQIEGKERVTMRDFLNGSRDFIGTILQ